MHAYPLLLEVDRRQMYLQSLPSSLHGLEAAVQCHNFCEHYEFPITLSICEQDLLPLPKVFWRSLAII